MKNSSVAVSLLAVVSALALTIPAAAEESYEPVGKVYMSRTEMGFLVSVGSGRGVLYFEDYEYPFRIGGLGVGGMGIHRTTAQGYVYNMDSALDLEGEWVELRSGITLGDAHTGATRLHNTGSGAIMTLRGTAEGVRLNLGATGLRVSLE